MSYAQAMLELAQEQKLEKEIYNAALVLRTCLLAQPRYKFVLSSPIIAHEEKLALVRELLHDAPDLLRNVVLLLCEQNNGVHLMEVLEQYVAYYREQNRILEVTAWSAATLSGDIKARLESALQKRFGQEVLLETKVDKACIGGLKLQMNGRQYDGSLARQLDEISRMLLDNTQIMYEINSTEVGDR